MTAIIFSAAIGPVPINVIVKETHKTELGITQNPIETGAEITDHAYVKPKRVTLDIADANAVQTYNALVGFQESRIPFSLVTGLFVYPNMLIASLNMTRDATYSRVLNGQVELQEAIIVSTAYAAGDQGEERGLESKGRQQKLDSSRAGDAATADRAAGTVARGDSPITTTPTSGASPAATTNRSILNRLF